MTMRRLCRWHLQQLQFRLHSSTSSSVKSVRTPLVETLHRRIRTTGPVTVADYMRECLTNPHHGYYMNNDVFGAKGDFITSPEISQVFGELLGVWIASEFQKTGDTGSLQVVELGPGRGTLASDIIRVLDQLEFMKDRVRYHLIDVSPKMRQLQARNICDTEYSDNDCHLTSKRGGVTISWHNSIVDVPLKGRCCFLAHEFLDALPIHKFQRTADGKYHEVLVDVSEDDSDPHYFRHVLSPAPTANCQIFIKPGEEREQVEVSPMAGMAVQEIAAKINEFNGFALIADYGHEGDKEDTYRGFKSHKLHNPLDTPGEADLTADVDFAFLKHCVSPLNVKSFGPISQQRFLHNLGVSVRLKTLLSSPSITPEARTDLLSAYKMLCNPDDMGERFKFLSLHPHQYSGLPAGFAQLE